MTNAAWYLVCWVTHNDRDTIVTYRPSSARRELKTRTKKTFLTTWPVTGVCAIAIGAANGLVVLERSVLLPIA